MSIALGRTLVGHFRTVEEARQCVVDLRTAGFGEDQIGFSSGPPAAVVTVMPGDRWAEARGVLRRDGGEQAVPRPGSAIREAVDRALRRT